MKLGAVGLSAFGGSAAISFHDYGGEPTIGRGET